MLTYKPFKFQTEGVQWISSVRRGINWPAEPLCGIIGDEMGLGKTAQALLAISLLIAEGKKVLLAVPGVTIPQWQREWIRWVLKGEEPEFGMGELFAVKGSSAPIPPGTSCIVSHQLFAKADFIQSAIKANFDGIIIDEGHKFGGRDTKRIKHLWALRNCSASHFESCRIVLTGTPVRNYAHEIYNLLHLVAPSVFRNFEDFARKYLTSDYKALWNPLQFHNDIRPFYIRRTVADVQKDLPAHHTTKLYTEITDPFIRKLYNHNLDLLDNFMNGSRYMGSGGDDDDGPKSLLGYLVRLRHITGLAKAKEPSIIESIADYLTTDNQRESGGIGNKVAIGLIHRFVADKLEETLKAAVGPDILTVKRVQGGMGNTDKDQSIREFIAAPQPAVILMNMEAGGAGIDGLQQCCSRSYVFERMWNGADEEQFEKRIARTGQKFPTETRYTIANGTIDQFFDEMVEMKREITGQTVNENWEADPQFMRQLAEKVVMNRLY
jgi:SNF2 family DNA or RNA helicase